MAASLHLYRKRFIPEEMISLHADEILLAAPALLVTRWTTLKPRADIAGGISAYFADKHCKVTKVLRADGSLVYWYCDIMQLIEAPAAEDGGRTLIMEDLLIDVIVFPDGAVRVVDLDEAAEAAERGLITPAQLLLALHAADRLLKDIYSGNFSDYQRVIEKQLLL